MRGQILFCCRFRCSGCCFCGGLFSCGLGFRSFCCCLLGGERLGCCNLFAVGETTAGEARSLGFRYVAASAGNGRDLADLIAAQGADGLLYLAGTPRAETFEGRLRELGIQFSVAECYRMQSAVPDSAEVDAIFADGGPDVILFYSRQTAEDFFRLPEPRSALPKRSTIRLLCLSEAVAGAVPAVLRKNVTIAPMPDERSLLSLL